jgi:hypothetical protein
MATFNAYITESVTYETTIEAESAAAALTAASSLDTTGLASNTDRSISVRLAPVVPAE